MQYSKGHISELTEKQADFIIARLIDYQNNVCPPKPEDREFITDEQKKYCFSLAYKLAKLSPSEVEVRDRLCGLICKVIKRNIKTDGDVFYKVTRSEGSRIIETLKRMIRSEERKMKRGEKNADV